MSERSHLPLELQQLRQHLQQQCERREVSLSTAVLANSEAMDTQRENTLSAGVVGQAPVHSPATDQIDPDEEERLLRSDTERELDDESSRQSFGGASLSGQIAALTVNGGQEPTVSTEVGAAPTAISAQSVDAGSGNLGGSRPSKTVRRRNMRKAAKLRAQEARRRDEAAASGQTIEDGNESASKRKKRRGRRGGGPNNGGTVTTAVTAPAIRGSGGVGATPLKRRRNVEDNSPTESMSGKRVCQNTTPERTFRDVVNDHLKVCLINRGSAGTISEGAYTHIMSYLREKMDLAIADGVSPRFSWSRLVDGKVRMACHDAPTLTWLRREIEIMPQGSESNIVVMDFEQIRKTRATMFVPGPVADVNILLARIAGQNRQLRVDEWQVYQTDTKEGGQVLFLGIDPASAAAVLKDNGRIFYEFGQLQMRVAARNVAIPNDAAGQ
ncbi:hypothetical protein DMENIID0001_144020 [Sergentomyia squamirostris]